MIQRIPAIRVIGATPSPWMAYRRKATRKRRGYLPSAPSRRLVLSKLGDVVTNMAGNIGDIPVKPCPHVAAGDGLLAIVAKMETQNQTPIGGMIAVIHVKKPIGSIPTRYG